MPASARCKWLCDSTPSCSEAHSAVLVVRLQNAVMSLSHSAPVGAATAVRDRRIVLNCGGVLSQISLALLQAHPHTLLAKLTSSLPPSSSSSYAHGDLFLDRDPLSFSVILNWYRYGKLLPPPNGSLAPEIIADDIVYFKLPVVADAGQGVQAVSGYTTSFSSGGGSSMSTLGSPGLAKLHSYAFPGSSPNAGQPLSRASSQFVETREFPARNNDDGMPAQQAPSMAPQLSHMGSLNSASAQSNYAQMDEDGTATANTTPVVHILPPTPPMLSAANSVATPMGGSSLTSPPFQPRFMHQMSGASGFPSPCAAPSPAASGYRALDSEDAPPQSAVPIISPVQIRAVSTMAPQTPSIAQSQPALTKAVTQPTAAAPAAAPAPVPVVAAAVAPATAPAAAVAAPAVAPAAVVRPRVPFDLAIEMLSCFKDVTRVEALALIDKAAVAKAPAGDYAAATDASSSASSSSVGGEEGSYLFRYCSEPAEKLADGSCNPDLFVLSYLHQRKMFNTKVWRVFLGRDNPLQAQTVQGYVLSEERAPNNKAQTHTSILTLTHAIIGTHAKAIVVA